MPGWRRTRRWRRDEANRPYRPGAKARQADAGRHHLALKRETADADGVLTRKLHLIADRLVEKAMAGDIQAINEINDRVDGRPGGNELGESAPTSLSQSH